MGLLDIYKELQTDLGCYIPNNGYLKSWADQGVLLLNTSLTVIANKANSHAKIGWEIFTDRIIELLNKCGFELINTYNDYSNNPVNAETQRMVIVARKTKTIFKDELK